MDPVAIVVRLIDRQGQQIGSQEHNLPREQLQPHLDSPDTLAEFVHGTLMPQAARVTMQAWLDALPLEARDEAMDRVGRIELILDARGAGPLIFTLTLTDEDLDENSQNSQNSD